MGCGSERPKMHQGFFWFGIWVLGFGMWVLGYGFWVVFFGWDFLILGSNFWVLSGFFCLGFVFLEFPSRLMHH